MTLIRTGALIGAALFCLSPITASAAESCAAPEAQVAQAKPKKKKGFGLGGILKAANQAGVGNLLGGGMLGNGTFGQVAGAVAGTAVSAAGGDSSGPSSGMMGHISGLAGGNRVAQVAGAVTGTAANLARNAPRSGERDNAPAAGTCESDAGAVVNQYK